MAFTQSESVLDNFIADSLTVNGTSVNDVIDLSGTQFLVNGGSVINMINKTDLIIDAGTGTDSINITNDLNFSGGQVTLSAASVNSLGNSILSADTLILSDIGNAGSQGAPLLTDINSLNMQSISGGLVLTDSGGFVIEQLASANVDITLTALSGDISNNAAISASGANLSLNAQNGDINLVDILQQNSINLNGNNVNIDNGGNALSINTIIATGALNMTANGITFDDTVSAAGDSTIDAQSGDITLNGNLSMLNTASLDMQGGTIQQNANLTAASGSLSLTAGQAINMQSSTSTITDAGDIGYQAGGDIGMASLSALFGEISLVSATGGILDANNGASNANAQLLSLQAQNGIGNSGALEIAVNQLDAINISDGEVNLAQTGTIDLIRLQNTGANGDVTFSSNSDIFFNPDSTVATITAGNLLMTTDTGSFLGLGTGDINRPDITAQNAIFIGRQGTFGTFDRSLTLNVPGDVFVDTRGSFNPLFVPPGPSSFVSEGIDFTILGTISAVAGEQLVEVESLSEVDPAIFTALRNYSLEDISIRMPRDQLYDDELEDNASTQ